MLQLTYPVGFGLLMSSDFLTTIHIMTYLAYKQQGSALVTSEEVADNIRNNPVVVRRLITKLKLAGLVDTVRGKKGGFRLSLPAKDICLLTLFRAIEGDDPDVFSLANMEKRTDCSPIADSIQQTLNELLRQSLNALKKDLSNRSVSDVLTESLTRINRTPCSEKTCPEM